MLRELSRSRDDSTTAASIANRIGRYRRPSNTPASPSSSLQPSPSPRQDYFNAPSPSSSKHTYLSPEERRHAGPAWSEASISPQSSTAVSPAINYDRELPDLPPDALSDIDANQLALRNLQRGQDEVRSRHLSQYESVSAFAATSPALTNTAPASKPDNSKQSAALRFASASTSAAVSAGLGLKKLGKKASAARLRRPNTSQLAQERDASYAALRTPSSNADPQDVAQSPAGSSYASSYASPSPHANSFYDSADPAIGLPYDVSHNVHVDVGPHGYTGLPSSWAQILLSEGMDEHQIRQDPHTAARLVEERTEYLVQQAVQSGADADETRRILSQKLAADHQLSEALAAAASASPLRSRPRRDSVQSSASSSYSSVLEKGWDLGSPPKPQAPQHFSPLPAKSPLLPDFAAEDYDDWATSLLSSIPSGASNDSATTRSTAADKASRRRSRSVGELVGRNSLNGLGIGIAADATPRRAATRDRDLLNASNATPKASHRLRASVGLDAESASVTSISSNEARHIGTLKHAQSIDEEVQERLRESLDNGDRDPEEDDEEVELVQIAQAAIATKGVLRPVRASQLSARKVSPSSGSLDFNSPHASPNTSVADLHSRPARSPHAHANSVASRPPSSLSDTRMSRSGSTDSYATANSHAAFGKHGSLSHAPPRIYTENVSMLADRDLASSPLETSSSGHSSFRIRSPALTVATSSLGHTSPAGTMTRGSPSPSLSVRESVSPEVPPKDADWRSRSPALSVSASESGDGAASPSAANGAYSYARRGPSSLDSGHVSGHQTQDSWASTAHSITSSEGSHGVTRGLGLRERRHAPPRIYPPSTSTRWAHIAHQDDSSSALGGFAPSRRSQQSPMHAPMQRKTSADALVRADRSPMSDVSQVQQVGQQHHDDRSSIRSARSDGEFAGLDSRDRRQPHLPSSASPTTLDGRPSPSGFFSPKFTQGSLQNGGRGSISSVGTSSRDSMGPPPPPPPKPSVVRKQPEYILPGADGFYTMPASVGTTGRDAVGSDAAMLSAGRLRPPPLSPALSPSSSTEASDYHATIEEWMRDDYSDRSPATTTFSATSPSPSSSSRDSPLPPLPKEDEEETFDSMPQASPYLTSPTVLVSSNEPTHNASQAPARDDRALASRTPSGGPPRLELRDSIRDTTRLEAYYAPPSPGESIEMLDDAGSGRGSAESGINKSDAGREAKGESSRERSRDDTRSVISIGPRAHDDARRFPVSMHYASGFDTASMLGDDSEAIRSFRELMLARQSMDLEDMMPLQMGADSSAPPVPSLPSMKELEAKVAAASLSRPGGESGRRSDESGSSSHSSGRVTRSSAASPSWSETGAEVVATRLPAKLSHLAVELDLQPLRRGVLCDLEMIGDGESGPVFAANDVVKKRRAAIKMVKFGADADSEPSARLKGLVKEVGVWRRCRHVNVLDLYSVVLGTDAIWMVQELAERSLADVIAWKESGVELSEARMSRIMLDLVEALQFLHGQRVLHRDVRSDNVMVSSTGVCKLSDFTHAGELGPDASWRQSVIGTPYWMAPEVIKADRYDTRCDVWSVGVVLWEMVEGEPPRVEFPPLRAITLTATLGLPALKDASSLSHELKSFLHWATEMDAEKRPSAEMLAMSDFLSDPCSRASIVALLEEARQAEAQAAREEAAEEAGMDEPRSGSGGRNGSGRRDSWSSDSTTKG
ncbi:uncharacterized protein PAN0_020d5920 [Moesziomyces antarcticus]|uniref:Related to Serine/threonine kinase n=2 Tax=Pseudozyma antarctica TaxID=84753 RepID=A0A5C3FY07_PSEA2|nr:uncharacterized protein PAN0_020d5920 [Moesziomyces antarcticus]GAK67691.1 conserved hypothetical protein [Moesziomyces antarcticus]SPO49076.1 related to Serine/threonine kinase [Moesziomyces antarcticus]